MHSLRGREIVVGEGREGGSVKPVTFGESKRRGTAKKRGVETRCPTAALQACRLGHVGANSPVNQLKCPISALPLGPALSACGWLTILELRSKWHNVYQSMSLISANSGLVSIVSLGDALMCRESELEQAKDWANRQKREVLSTCYRSKVSLHAFVDWHSPLLAPAHSPLHTKASPNGVELTLD